MRVPREKRTVTVDLTVPVNVESMIKHDDQSCFGKEWDMREKACVQCADNDVCSILFNEYNKKSANSIEASSKARFLDLVDFEVINEATMLARVESGVTTASEILQWAIDESRCDDLTTVTEVVKRVIKDSDKLYTKGGLVWTK